MKNFLRLSGPRARPAGFRLPLASLPLVAAGLLAAACAPGGDPGLAERLDEARALADARERELAGLRSEATSLRARVAELEARPAPAAPAAAPAALRIKPLKEVSDDFANEALAYRSKLESGLSGFALDGLTLQRVDASGVEQAYRTTIVLRLNDKQGGPQRELPLPVFADVGGRWNFPEPAEVERLAAATPAAAQPQPTQPGVAEPAPGAPVVLSPPPGQPAGAGPSTVIVQWGNRNPGQPEPQPGQPSPPAPAPPRPPNPPQPAPPAPAPPGGTTPAPVMPSNKDVKIEF
jgi:hypothetical protein